MPVHRILGFSAKHEKKSSAAKGSSLRESRMRQGNFCRDHGLWPPAFMERNCRRCRMDFFVFLLHSTSSQILFGLLAYSFFCHSPLAQWRVKNATRLHSPFPKCHWSHYHNHLRSSIDTLPVKVYRTAGALHFRANGDSVVIPKKHLF